MDRKWWLLLSSLVALAALALLASSLHDVHFQPGRSAPSVATPSSSISLPAPDALTTIPLWKVLLFWGLFLISVLVLISFLSPELRKRLIKQILTFSLTLLAFYLALRYRLIQLPQFLSGPPAKSAQPGLGPESNSPAAVFQPPAITSWLSFLISLGVFLAVLLLIWIGYRWWSRFSPRRSSQLTELAAIARDSLDDLTSGREWGDVVIQSYRRMSRVVGETRGLQRAEAMTPREFARRIESAGLPSQAVGRLTRLFESVRYGGTRSTEVDVNEAIACLSLILQACGAPE